MTSQTDADPVRRWFPLVARPRPACPPLTDRVTEVAELARTAADQTGPAALSTAAAAQNKAALIASDCGLPDLARSWCWRQFDAYLGALPWGAQVAKHALEPLVNLARLRIREGDGEDAYRLLDTLHRALRSRSTIEISGRLVPFAEVAASGQDWRDLCRWMWAVFLADGSRALAAAGRWEQALTHVEKHGGLGQRLLDGRQVAILAHWSAGNAHAASSVLNASTVSEPWEHAVAACLAALCHRAGSQPADTVTALTQRYLALDREPALLVFRVRLGLATIDLAGGIDKPAAARVTARLVREVLSSGDGYAAREVLMHDQLRAWLDNTERRALSGSVHASGLGSGGLPDHMLATLDAAIDTRLMTEGQR